ncbi:UNVERIFIED_CONTAM: hypothetical protein RMT77_003725 [Armadillidium vulgare]
MELSQNSKELHISQSRTSEDVLQMLEHAKIDNSELIPLTQSLYFSNTFGDEDDLKLIEVDNDMLKYLNEGKRFTIRGDGEESSVLCTDSKTFEVREAETSNSLLLVPNLEIPQDEREDTLTVSNQKVVSIQYKYFELKPCQPKLGKLIKCLERLPYKGRDSTKFGYKWHDLLNEIQCSEEELEEGLRRNRAYFIDEYWCLLDFEYHFGVLSLFLNLIDSNSVPLNEIKKDELMEELKELESQTILEQCFNYFFSPVEGKDTYKINENDVSQFCAEVLLKPAGKFNLNEFLNVWQQSVPQGVITDLSQLKGVALVDKDSSPPVIWHFPVSYLPLDIGEAVTVLFETRSKWALEDIAPYLREFTSPKASVVSVLSKYARASTVNGIKYFTSKHST